MRCGCVPEVSCLDARARLLLHTMHGVRAAPWLDPLGAILGTVSSNFIIITYLIHRSALSAPLRARSSRTKGVHRTRTLTRLKRDHLTQRHCVIVQYDSHASRCGPPDSLLGHSETSVLTASGVSITVCRLFSTSLLRLARARLAPARTPLLQAAPCSATTCGKRLCPPLMQC